MAVEALDAKTGRGALAIAAAMDMPDVVGKLLKHGADPGLADDRAETDETSELSSSNRSRRGCFSDESSSIFPESHTHVSTMNSTLKSCGTSSFPAAGRQVWQGRAPWSRRTSSYTTGAPLPIAGNP